MLDLFDGEAYSSNIIKFGADYVKYMKPQDFIRKGDVIGVEIDLKQGTV